MPNEVPRCSDCGTALKAVPTWLATAKVSFTCGSCPRRSSRVSAMRLDKPIETKATLVSDDPDVEIDGIPEIDEDSEMEIEVEELDDVKDDVDL